MPTEPQGRERAHMKKSQISNWGFSEHLTVLPKELPEVVKEQAKQAGIDGYCNIPELEKRMLSVWEAARREERERKPKRVDVQYVLGQFAQDMGFTFDSGAPSHVRALEKALTALKGEGNGRDQ